jgi:hemoglobin
MNDSPTLYEKLGRETGVESLVLAFYVRVLADPELAPFFRSASFEKLYAMQQEFFSMALGGPGEFASGSLAHAHHGRGITPQHFGRFAGHLLDTLKEKGISEAEAEEVINRLNSHANEVTGVSY